MPMRIGHYLPTILVLTGSVTAAIGGVTAAIGVFLGDSERARSAEKLAAKSDEIAGLNREIINLTTGGDSYVYLSLGLGWRELEVEACPVTLKHKGSYTVYDISIRIVDLTAQDYLRRAYAHYPLSNSPGADPA